MFKFTIIAVALFITTAINIIATVISWRRAKSRFGFYFAMGMTGITFWTLASGLDYAAVPIPLKVFFTKWEYVGYHIALIYFLMFVLSYAGYGSLLENKFVRTLLWVAPASNVLLAWTNEWHHWLWSGFVRSQFGDNTVIFEHGPAFLWVAGVGYLILASIILTAWLASRRGAEYARRQGRLLFYGSLLPLLGNLIYQFQPLEFDGVDWSSILLSISSLLFLWVLYGMHLLDLVPIAREKLIDGLQDGMVVLDMQGRIVDINQPVVQMIGSQSRNLVGKRLDELISPAQWLSELPPERERRTELEIGGAEKHYFDVLISPLFEKHTEVIGQLITFHDVTVRKQNELRLLQLTRAVEQSPTSVIITDLEGNITYVNPWFTALTGYTPEEIIGENPRILKSGQTPSDVYRDLWVTINSGKVWKGELLNKKKNGDLYWEYVTIAPVLDHAGRMLNFIAVKVDITEQKRAEKALQELAATDPLTGLFNRRHFFDIVNVILTEAMRYGYPVALLLFDIDHFKQVNDTYGHMAGDLALQHLVKAIRLSTRAADIAARFGGDEFIILLPQTDGTRAVHLAERLQDYLAENPVPNMEGRLSIMLSIGIASLPVNQETISIDTLLEHADKALYDAKKAGRNRVRVYDQSLDEHES